MDTGVSDTELMPEPRRIPNEADERLATAAQQAALAPHVPTDEQLGDEPVAVALPLDREVLDGRAARAVDELKLGNQQDPYTLYRLGLAYQGKGEPAKAAELFEEAANQNTLPTLNYAFVRQKAKRMKV